MLPTNKRQEQQVVADCDKGTAGRQAAGNATELKRNGSGDH